MTKHFLTGFALTLVLAGCPDDSPDLAVGDASIRASASSDASTRSDAHATSDSGTTSDTGAGGDAAGASDYASLEQRATSKYKTCGAYEPSVDPRQYTVEDSFDACFAQCLLAAPCEELKALLCDGVENALETCIDSCDSGALVADGYRCRDGSVIPHGYLCDFEPDCANDEDEQNCGEYECADGEVVPNRAVRCDHFEDCGDGSDEQGCAFTCQ